MDQAKQAASYVTEFIQGNPLTTPAGIRVERATDSQLQCEDWELNMEICDIINYSEQGASDTVRAIRKRLQNQMATKEKQSVLYTLTLLETCVKNGNHRFHRMVMDKEYIRSLVALIGPKHDPPQAVQERVLGLIQSWADAFREDPALNGVCLVYDELKAKGVEFPATDLDTMAPILTPKRTVARNEPQADVAPVVAAEAVPGAPASFRPQPVAPTAEQLAKLRSELDVVGGNAKVLREMMTELTPGAESAEDSQLMEELHATLKEMQARIVALFQRVASDDVTNELLMINDELNNVFEKYERYSKNKNTASGTNLANLNSAASGSDAKQGSSDKKHTDTGAPDSGEPTLIDLNTDLSQQMDNLAMSSGATAATNQSSTVGFRLGGANSGSYADNSNASADQLAGLSAAAAMRPTAARPRGADRAGRHPMNANPLYRPEDEGTGRGVSANFCQRSNTQSNDDDLL